LPAAKATQKPNNAAFGYGNVFISQCKIVVKFKNKCSMLQRLPHIPHPCLDGSGQSGRKPAKLYASVDRAIPILVFSNGRS
jgi:hypothetical protein